MQIFSQTNIYDISRSGDLEALKDIYKHTPELINQTNDKGYSPLVLATYHGHAEVVKVTFDPSIINTATLLEVFFTCHDPTQLNRQGNDIGPHYRSAIFYTSEGQREDSESVIEKMETLYENEIVTEVTAFKNFYVAENYHHDYFKNNPSNPYCRVIVAPKIAKTRAKHVDLYE